MHAQRYGNEINDKTWWAVRSTQGGDRKRFPYEARFVGGEASDTGGIAKDSSLRHRH